MVSWACREGWDVTAWLSQAPVLRLPEVLLQQILQAGPCQVG